MYSKFELTIAFVGVLAVTGAGPIIAQETTCDTIPVACGNNCSDEVLTYDRSILQTSVFRKDAVAPLNPLAYPVQAVNFTGHTAWAAGKEGHTVVLSRDLWFTVEPELKIICNKFPADTTIPKLHKVLGLKPATTADAGRQFVLFTIEKEEPVGPTGHGAFRPCADPDPAATQCGNDLKGPPQYLEWFTRNMVSSYKVDPNMSDTGYPWTRLGYTFNWDKTSSDHRGAQEYVVPAGTSVRIRAVVSPAEYCR